MEDRFKAFLSQMDNVESIDDTLSDAELVGGKRADFLLDGRRVVLEIKSLEADPEKINKGDATLYSSQKLEKMTGRALQHRPQGRPREEQDKKG